MKSIRVIVRDKEEYESVHPQLCIMDSWWWGEIWCDVADYDLIFLMPKADMIDYTSCTPNQDYHAVMCIKEWARQGYPRGRV